jgi:hypothetical protein
MPTPRWNSGELSNVPTRQPQPSFADFRVVFSPRPGGARFTISRRGAQILTCAFAVDEEAGSNLWPHLEKRFLDLTDRNPMLSGTGAAPVCPSALPFVATLILPAWDRHGQVLSNRPG